MKKIPILLRSLLIIFLILSIHQVKADEDEDEEDDAEDIGKNLGTAAIGLLSIGFSYIFLRRSYVYSRKYLSDEDHGELKQIIKTIHKKLRSPLLILHNATMIIATVLGVIHGIIVGLGEIGIGVSGWIAAGSMIILSISGLIIWVRFRPIWNYRKQRTTIRFLHQQWLFTGIMLIALLLHVSIFED